MAAFRQPRTGGGDISGAAWQGPVLYGDVIEPVAAACPCRDPRTGAWVSYDAPGVVEDLSPFRAAGSSGHGGTRAGGGAWQWTSELLSVAAMAVIVLAAGLQTVGAGRFAGPAGDPLERFRFLAAGQPVSIAAISDPAGVPVMLTETIDIPAQTGSVRLVAIDAQPTDDALPHAAVASMPPEPVSGDRVSETVSAVPLPSRNPSVSRTASVTRQRLTAIALPSRAGRTGTRISMASDSIDRDAVRRIAN